MRDISFAVATMLAFCLAALPLSPAGAHGSVPINEDPCARSFGRNIVHFSAYQPQFDKSGHYCDEIPKTGKTIIVVDLFNRPLRKVPVSLTIVDASADEFKHVLMSVKPKVYAHGVIEALAIFSKPGLYRVIVTVADGTDEERSFSFRVAPNKVWSYVTSGLIYGVVLILFGMLIGKPIWNMVQRWMASA